jgi:hypothetical protein
LNKLLFFKLNIYIILDAQFTIEPRNGGCEPRIVCEEVPVDRTTSSNIISFPQCVEVHRCGGCCQEPQFPCVPVQQQSVTFSPVNKQKLISSFFIYKLLLVIISFFG